VFSLLSLSPVTLTLGAIALGGLAIATNFLGLRTIFIGLGKMVLGMAKIVFAIGKGFFQLGRAVRQIFTGIFTLDFGLIKQGAQTAWNAIVTGAGELKDALKLIFGGIWDVVRGVFQGIGQILAAPFRGVRGAIAGIRTAFATVGSAVSQILAGVRGAITRVRNSFSTTSSAISQAITNPRQVWESFLNLLERIRQKVTGVMDAISSSAVGRAARAVTGQSKGKGKENVTTPPIPPVPEVAAIERTPAKQGWGARLFGKKKGVESVPEVVAPVPEVAAIEPAPAKKGWGARLFGKKEAQPAVTPVPEIPSPKPIAAVEAVKSSAVGRSVRAMSKMQAGQVVSLDEGRSAVDFEERLKGKEPGLSLSDQATVAKKGITDRLLGPKKPTVPTEDLPEEINTGARSINAANTALSSLAGTLSSFAPAAAAPLFAVSGLVDSFFSVSDALPDVKSGLVQLFPQMKGLSGVAKTAIAPVGKTLQGAITPIGSILQSAIAPIGPVIMTAIAPLAPFILPILAGIAAGAFLVHQAFKNNFLGISTFVTNLFNGVKQFFGLLFGGAWDALASVFITLETQIKGIWNALVSVGNTLIEPFQPLMRLFGINGSGGGFFGAAMKGVVNAILLPLRVVTGTINIVLRILGQVITSVVKLGGFILGVWLAPLRLIFTTVGLIWSGITGLVGGIISAGGAIISFLLTPFRAAFNLLSKIPLIGGLLTGMQPTAPGADTPANIPAYASGGFVPKTGLALIHEGEFVANPAVTGRNLEILQRMHAGEDVPTANVEVLPAIPAPLPAAPSTTVRVPATTGGGGGGTTVQIHIENITVVSQGESSEELARDLFEELKPYLVQFFGEEGSNNPHLVRFYRGAGKNALNHLR
jgi:phage-related protein